MNCLIGLFYTLLNAGIQSNNSWLTPRRANKIQAIHRWEHKVDVCPCCNKLHQKPNQRRPLATFLPIYTAITQAVWGNTSSRKRARRRCVLWIYCFWKGNRGSLLQPSPRSKSVLFFFSALSTPLSLNVEMWINCALQKRNAQKSGAYAMKLRGASWNTQ